MKTIIMEEADAVRADQAAAKAKELPHKLASAFSRVLHEWLTPLEMSKVIVSNTRAAKGGDLMTCATHDYCDANMAMDEAFKRVLGRGMYLIDDKATEEQKDADTDLWNEAWTISKQAKFRNVL